MRKIDLFDGHCDTLFRLWRTEESRFNGGSLRRNNGHIDLLRAGESVGGQESVAIGTDFDGCTPCSGIRDVADMGLIYERLLRMNYSETQVHAIFFDNLMRVVREVCTM